MSGLLNFFEKEIHNSCPFCSWNLCAKHRVQPLLLLFSGQFQLSKMISSFAQRSLLEPPGTKMSKLAFICRMLYLSLARLARFHCAMFVLAGSKADGDDRMATLAAGMSEEELLELQSAY